MEFWKQTWTTILDFCAPVGNFASVAGLLVSVLGFCFTIWAVMTAKAAARRAECAAIAARDNILKSGAIAKFSCAISLMEEIKRLQRRTEWGVLLDRYAELRRVLIELQSEAVGLAEEQQGLLGGVISQFGVIEKKVEKLYAGEKAVFNVGTINGLVSKQIGKVLELSTKFKMK